MSETLNSDRDEVRLSAMLRTIDADAAPPDPATFDELRRSSAETFAASISADAILSSRSVDLATQSTTGLLETTRLADSARPSIRRPPMFTFAMRGAVAASMMILALATWFISNEPTPLAAGTVPFSKILDELRGASTLELSLFKRGTQSHILVRAPGLIRKEESSTRYEIAAGSRLWRIDESANTVEEGDSRWFLGPTSQIDLLSLLDLNVTDASALLRARPVERAMAPSFDAAVDRVAGDRQVASDRSPQSFDTTVANDQGRCDVYRVELPTEQGRVEVEAFVNPVDKKLVGIFAWPAGGKRKAGPPLAEMRLISMNHAVGDEKFQVAQTLTEDGRIGSVTQSQGIVVLRPMLAKRWSPIGSQTLLKPGDWLRTELRGANATRIVLASDVELTVGPGTLLECISPDKARVHYGTVQVSMRKETAPSDKEADPKVQPATAPKDVSKNSTEFTLLAPRDGQRVFKTGDKQLVRVNQEEKLVDVPHVPVWLAGFDGTTNNESLGSLIVNLPDGRNEPLTVGYHKVTVEIRDQIARTTIEESFVNHTISRLEGVFHFPLPQDASISGFGMWIGNELVEADIVEKQRAREIYETILRERRDPGLLEWTGGNLFKARVFPIEPHSEKRIKIVYTQVLPLRGNQYRYSYGLRSDLLRTNPVRELSVAVTVNSALGLKSITCPTHPARIQHSPHAGRVEFSAQEYSPTRDLEVVCEVDQQQSDVVVVPHRRGDDGYFLVQITPPFQQDGSARGAVGTRLNELVPDGNPLSILLMCDTSASMDSDKRSKQAEFVATVLSSLGPDDRFQLAACDVKTVWGSESLLAPTEDNIGAALKFLNDRLSLGWTNLDRAFDEVLKKSLPGSQIVYIGDGIVTAGDTDPAAFVQRLGQRFGQIKAVDNVVDQKGNGSALPITFHSVSVGNVYESVVLKGIASVGRGSVRTIGGEKSAQVTARELLNEIAQPGLREVNVEFRGVRVAAVYPGRLPNVAAGTQQILVGRYLPEPGNGDQQGEVIVTGLRGTEKVKFAARISLKNAEEGNSFIPRLWARAHLDHLLAQGQSSLIHDQIIRLSEEFHIITPYTSLLVLETDADRERFGVQRRYEMRDGERFFADGSDNANYELRQLQMKRAGDWRLGMRNQVLRSLALLGRNPQLFNQHSPQKPGMGRYNIMGAMGSGYRSAGRVKMNFSLGDMIEDFDDEYLLSNIVSATNRSYRGEDHSALRLAEDDFKSDFEPMAGRPVSKSEAYDKQPLFDAQDGADWDEPMSLGVKLDAAQKELGWSGFDNGLTVNRSLQDSMSLAPFYEAGGFEIDDRKSLSGGIDSVWDVTSDAAPFFGGGPDQPFGSRWNGRGAYPHFTPDYTSWINSLFPHLDPLPTKPILEIKDPEQWSPEAVALAKSLLRTDSLRKFEGGVEVLRQVDSFDPSWKRSTGRHVDLALYSSASWLTRSLNFADQTLINYCDSKERGVYSLAFQLGRSRPSAASELTAPPLSLSDWSITSLSQSYHWFVGRVEPSGNNRVTLVLTAKDASSEVRMTIDTMRHVILDRKSFSEGKLVESATFEDFVEMAGSWWATKIASVDSKGQPISTTTLRVTQLSQQQHADRVANELTGKPSVQFIHLPFVRLRTARQKVADGSATFDDHLMMIVYNAQLQQWDEIWKHVDALEKQAADKPGIRWLRTMLLATSRRNEEAMKRLNDEAVRLTQAASQDEVNLAEFILYQASALASVNETFKLQQLLKPIYDRPLVQRVPTAIRLAADSEQVNQAASAEIERQIQQMWIDREMASLESLGRNEVALALRHATAVKMPWDHDRQQLYAHRLAAIGRFAEAHDWLRKALARPEVTAAADESLRSTVADLYRQQAKWNELLTWTTEWIARNPESTSYSSAYSQHLAAMIFNNQLEAAYKLADQWLVAARIPGKMTAVQRSRLDAALNFANGQLHQISMQRMEERWFEPLAETARFFVRHPHHFDIVARCVSNYYFTQTDHCDQLRGEWLEMLRSDLATLSPNQIGTLVGWTLSGRMELAEPINGRKQLDASEVPNEVWSAIANKLKERWSATLDHDDKTALGETLRTIYLNRFAETELIPFLRERITSAPQERIQQYTSALFDALLSAKWTDEIEIEAFATWRRLSDKTTAVERLQVELPALMRLVDAMLASRIAAGEKVLSDQGGLDKLTRKELAAKKGEIRKDARRGLSSRLATEATRSDNPGTEIDTNSVKPSFRLADWLTIERTWLDVQDKQDLTQVEADCWKILGEIPPVPTSPDEADKDVTAAMIQQAALDAILRQRAFSTVAYLCTRKDAAPASIDRLLKYIDAGITHEIGRVKPVDGSAIPESKPFWRQMKFRLLIALDRPDELEKELRQWIRLDGATSPWRQLLARLVAERGKLDEAIQLFEACEPLKLLTSADYSLLADWYLVVNRREAYERSRIESYLQMPEQNLARMIYSTRNRWVQTNVPLPSEIDENTLFAFKALLKKSGQPENYFYQLRDIYAASRDFRMLEMLPDAILGRSPQQVYAFILGLQNSVLYELRNEATADELLARLKTLRKDDRTATDLRALDLLEAFVERKSAEILNQPGPHIDACLAALQRAFQRQWSEGEPRMMSQFLANIGLLPHDKLKTEQLREMRALRMLVPLASREHLAITGHLGQLLFWSYNRRADAMHEMKAELDAYLNANGGVWPYVDNDFIGNYVTMLEHTNEHVEGESLLKKFIAHPENAEQLKWLNDRMMALYNHALEHDSAVSIGSGRKELFQSIVDLTLKELETAPNEEVRHNLVNRLNTTFDIAHRHHVATTADIVRKFAFETMPGLLPLQTTHYRNTAVSMMPIFGTVLTKEESLRYVVERMEQWPQRLEIQYDNSWSSLGGELAARRDAAGSTGLDDRILKLAITHLQRELRQGDQASQAIYYVAYQHFWREKTQEFAQAAEDVLKDRRSSGRRAVVVANYLRNGLHLMPRAVEILLIAHGKGLLDESAQYQLVAWLHQDNRYAEMIPILDQLIAVRPDNITYRTEQMVAYSQSKRMEQLLGLIEMTDKHFHQAGRWTEANIAQFARGCQGAEQWERAKAYFTEAIALHQRANGENGLNNAVLSDYYQQLARVESKLKHTAAAVTAASAAIVCWDSRHHQRQQAMSTLREILNASTELLAYVEYLDGEAAKTGQDSPILRKAIGDTFRSRNDYFHAIGQYKIAAELQPTDKEIHQSLIACYDATNDKSAANAQLLKLIDLQGHDLTLYVQLAERLKDDEAERAATSIVESAPNESESHTALAELRQKQGRWSEAIPHWEQVAKLRKLEPTGLLRLAAAQIHEKQWDQAKTSLNQLSKTDWPSRFLNVNNEIRQLENQLPTKP